MPSTNSSTRDQYLAHIAKQIASGLSIKKYCEQNNLMEHKFSYYRTYNLKSKKVAKADSPFASIKLIESKANKEQHRVDPVWLAQFVKAVLG